MLDRDPERGSATVAIAAGAALLLPLAGLAVGAVAGVAGQETAATCNSGSQPAASGAAASIPPAYLAGYKKAGTQYGIPWTVLAGIGTVESDNGKSTLPGVHTGTNPFGAAGPMQIGVEGASGDAWGGTPVHPASEQTGGVAADGDGDGTDDVYDPADAIPAAARYLAAHGASSGIQGAVFAYNHSQQYVQQVMSWSARYSSGGGAQASAASSTACQQAGAGPLPAGSAGRAVAFAEKQTGLPYQWGATGPGAYDCSGLVMMAWRAAGVAIPRTSQAQWAAGTKVPASQVRAGDLVYFAGSDGTPASPGHVGIVVNPAKHEMINAYETGTSIAYATYGLPSSQPGLTTVIGFTRP